MNPWHLTFEYESTSQTFNFNNFKLKFCVLSTYYYNIDSIISQHWMGPALAPHPLPPSGPRPLKPLMGTKPPVSLVSRSRPVPAASEARYTWYATWNPSWRGSRKNNGSSPTTPPVLAECCKDHEIDSYGYMFRYLHILYIYIYIYMYLFYIYSYRGS